MSGPRPVGFSIFPGKFPPGAARDRFYSLNRRVSWLGRVPSLPPVSPPAGHAPIHLGTLSMADVGGRKIKSWKLLTAAGKIPLEASALPHTCVGTAGGRYGNLGCSGSASGRPPAAPSLKTKGEVGHLLAFLGGFGIFWEALSPRSRWGFGKWSPFPTKPRDPGFSPVSGVCGLGQGTSPRVTEYHRISQNSRGWKGPLWVI